jgi:glc operon protein GlcG
VPASLGITLPEARVIVDAAVAYGRSVNGAAGIAVVDGAGNVVSLDRMDGTSYQQDRQAAGKARIAVMLRQRSSISAGLIETAPDRYFSTLSMFPGELFWQAGGVPLVVDGHIVGGVGVSGLVSGGDDLAADAAIEAWQRYRETLR